MVAENSWTHNIIIIEKCKDEHERFYYINLTKQNRWSKTMLTNAIVAQTYQRMLINQTNFAQTLATNIQKFFPTNDEFVERVESITKYISEKEKNEIKY